MVIRSLLVLFLVLFGVFVIPISAAEGDYNSSGSISYSYGESNSYYLGSGGPQIRTIYTGSFVHLFTNAKFINHVKFYNNLWSSSLAYTKNDATIFTATVDGTYYGTGVSTVYEDGGGDIIWDVDFYDVDDAYALTLTGAKVVTLNYENSIWSGISQANEYVANSALSVLTSAQPTSAHVTTGYLVRIGSVFTSYSTQYVNNYTYSFNSTFNLSSLSISKGTYSSLWSVYDLNNSIYFEENDYSITAISQDFVLLQGVYANVTFDVGGGSSSFMTIDSNVTIPVSENGDGVSEFEFNITTELDEFSPGDTVNVTYTTDQKGTIQVVKTISGDIYHSIGFVSGATNATWDFYIAGNEPYGFYDVYLLDSSNSILDSVILSIEDPDGVEVWNESIGALMYDYIYYTPTIKTGIYTAYLYDDSTLNDTVMVYLADPPIIDDPLDPETNGSIVVEDVLGDDETMTEYYNEKFRDFAPTIWGFFMLMCLLFLMSILTSFNSGGKR
jgi:hypothetical protein